MRKTFLLLPTALLVSLGVVACGGGGASGSSTPAPVTPSPVTPAPFGVLSPTSLTFGAQAANTTSAPQALTLSNTGTASLPINSIEIAMFFAQSNNCGQSVAPGASCSIEVTFDPTMATGIVAGTIEIFDNAASGAQTATLVGDAIGGSTGTGTGTPSGTSTITINATDGAGHTFQMPATVTVK